ncbi:MAG: DegT/DnrJ/EryC1/StrS family aminotransferase [Candidatus Omnitrophica bacterium]|nr:DegT/DnrJ/EryC1/StrS family aminotransferase [Candidatus Omnitrophota bacterium]
MKIAIPHSKPTIDSTDVKTVAAVIKSGYLTQGVKVAEFEKKLARYIGVRGAVTVSSGTAALHLALLTLEIKKGDEVIAPTYVCTAILNAINYTGARIRLVDVNPEDGNISVKEVKKKITRKTKAIIVPHMFGMPADIYELVKLGIPIIEDCAQAIGATYKNKKVGNFGVLSIFSFYATKMLTTGEGGAVVSNNLSLLNKIKDLREYDHKNDYQIRFNYKMTDIQAVLGINQLAKLKTFIAKRRKIAAQYNKELSHCDFELPVTRKDKKGVCFRYVIKVKRGQSRYFKYFKREGIICARPLYKPLHRYLRLKGFPVAERLTKESISIPIYPSLTSSQVASIIQKTKGLSQVR